MVSFHPTDTGLEVRHRHEVLTIEPWGADSVRVRAAPYRIPAESQGALDEPPLSGPPVVKVDDSRATLVHGELTVTVDFDRAAPYPEPLLTLDRKSVV